MKNRNKNAFVAYHEAGHAVMCWCLGLRVPGATVVPDEDSAGHVESLREKPSTYKGIDSGDRWHPSRLRLEKRVMILQAGEVAQRRYNSGSVRRVHSQDDFYKCRELLRKYAPDEKKLDIENHYLMLRKWTIHLIEQHWYLVEAVATALLECGEKIIDGYQLVRPSGL